ncbi:MAG: hypothetical protein KBD16_01275 [Candidatus Pacebacteria bacterium]|nr:hypothetical protein [Candidatus Paceibacterota bacterium]
MKHARFLIPLAIIALSMCAHVAHAQINPFGTVDFNFILNNASVTVPSGTSTSPILNNGTYGATYRGKVHDIFKIPFAWYITGSPFAEITVMGNGDFVVAGACSLKMNRAGWRSLIDEDAGANKDGRGGLYAFKNDGTFIGDRDVCLDGLSTMGSCPEGGACNISTKVIPVGNDRIIREMAGVWNRPPMEYRIGSNGISLVKRAYISKGSNYDSESHAGRFVVNQLVKAAGGLWGVKEENVSDGQLRYARSNIIYSDTGFNEVREWSVSAPSSLYESWNEIAPIVGVGDYVIGTKTSNNDTTVYVFKAVDGSTMDEWKRLEQIGTLPGFGVSYADYQFDPSNPNRVAFLMRSSGGLPVSVDFYEAGTTTLSKVSTTPIPDSSSTVGTFAVQGEYVLYGYCPAGNASVMPVTDGNADPFKGCKVKILKAGSLVGEIILPKWSGFPISENAGGTEQAQIVSVDDAPISVGMSANGTIMIGSSYGGLYRYTLGGTTTPPPGPNVGPTGVLQLGGVESYLNFAKGYLQLLGALFGGQTTGTTTEPTTEGAQTSPTQFDLLFNEATNLINTYGQ